MNIETEARILGGLPVTVIGKVHPAEPDVGIFDKQPEVIDIRWNSGRSIPKSMWLRLSDEDFSACEEALCSEVESQ